MSIFEGSDYKIFFRKRLKSFPKEGRGQLLKVAAFLKTPPSTLSQVFHGDRHLTLEQAADIVDFLALSEKEAEYFLALVELARAGNPRLRKHCEKRLARIKEESQSIKTRVEHKKTLGENEKFIFYSSWHYSAVRILTSIPGFQRPPQIAASIGLSLQRVQEVLEFLVRHGLCVEAGGKYSYGPSSTHIGAEDPLVFRHHGNWRERALARHNQANALKPHELSLTIPTSTSREAMEKVKRELLDCADRVFKIFDESECELFGYLTLDLAEMAKQDA
jgi:uncharacterized protein (TIGR02147 family)